MSTEREAIIENTAEMKNEVVELKSSEPILKHTEHKDYTMDKTGDIFDKDNNLVCVKMLELVDANFENVKELKTIDDVQFCEDGTVVRVWKDQNEIQISTKKCIDASKSWWSLKDFNTLFWECIPDKPKFIEAIDSGYTYMFVIKHPENIIVVKHKTPTLVHIATIDNKTGKNLENSSPIPFVYKCQKPKIDFEKDPIETIKHLVNNNYIQKRGLLVFSENKIWKFDYPHFKVVKNIRGNVPYIGMRYLELNKEPEMQKQLLFFFPEYRDVFSSIHYNIAKTGTMIHRAYINVFIKKTDQLEFTGNYERTLVQLHGEYRKFKEVITYEKVMTKLNNMDGKILQYVLGWKC